VANSAAAPATAAATHGGGDLAHARHLIEQANSHKDIQTSFASLPKPDPKAAEFWRHVFEGIGDFFRSTGKVFAPLAPVMPYVFYLLAIALILLLLSPVVRMFISTRFERLFARDHLKGETAWRPTKAAVVALLHDIDALAAKGEYDEAVHLLLMRSVADINAWRPDVVRAHYSARDISSHPVLPEAARPAFSEIVRWVEQSYFAGIAVGKDGFDACRAAYVAFVAAEGIA
jgi:hypothetical protein